MKKLVLLLTATAALAFCSTANAIITDAYWDADDDGVIDCNTWTWTGGTAPTLWMSGDQLGLPGDPFAPGHMVGYVTLDSAEDPILTLNGTINNQTASAWYGYQINVIMSIPFTFVSPGPTVGNPPIYDWFVAGVGAPTVQLSGPYIGQYMGSLYFSKGTDIMFNESLDFLYSIEFSGSWGFQFTQEMIPWATTIPEPSTAVLAGFGALVLALRLRRNRRA